MVGLRMAIRYPLKSSWSHLEASITVAARGSPASLGRSGPSCVEVRQARG